MTPSLPDVISRAARGEITLLDVRELSELQTTGKAEGALHVPLSLLPLNELPKDKPVAVYCAAGARAGQAVQHLEAKGHEAWNIGGFGHWASAGGPVVRV